METLPINALRAVEDTDGNIIFISGNGRFALKGELYDVWAKKKLTTIAEIKNASERLDMAGLNLNWADLKPFKVGKGAKTVRVFVDPRCPYCRQLMEQLPSFKDYTFELYVVPILGDQSEKQTRLLSCAKDQRAALAALLTHQGSDALDQVENCDLTSIQKRVITAKLIGISAVPYVVATDGRFSLGIPPDLGNWLHGPQT